LKIKLKGHHFDTTEVIRAESHVVLNTLIEHHFQDALRTTAEALVTVHARKGTNSMMVVASRPKVSFFFYQMAAPVPEIMDNSF
jgi:hypothetical protein